ncbi:MAG: S9 family peptidase [candidate division WOR-3 bacterium]|nr:MAG: S9 family peptidase [candidate division WOR-3 bacterium]
MAFNKKSLRWNVLIVLFIVIVVLYAVCGSHYVRSQAPHTVSGNQHKISPPIAEIIQKADTLFGDIRIDNYYWLRDRSNPAVIAYLEAENNYTEAMMKHTEEFQEQLYKEMLGRIKETDTSAVDKIDEYFYYSRTEEGKQYLMYCRKKGSLESSEEIVLDLNELARGHAYLYLGAYRVSPNHKFLAYSIDTAGSERFVIYIKNLEENVVLEEKLLNASGDVVWANDNKTFFYVLLDEAKRPYKLYRHSLGNNQGEDVFIYHEKDDAFWLDISKTKSKEYVLMNLGSHTSTEIHYVKADKPAEDFEVIQPRVAELEYYVEHREDKFYIMTNDNAKNFKIVEASVQNASIPYWQEFIPHRDNVKISGFDVFKNHLVVYGREMGLENIQIVNLLNNECHYVDFLEPVYTFWADKNPNFSTNILRFNYTSLTTPKSVFDYNMDIRTRKLKKQYQVLGGYDPLLYQSERIFAQARDGTEIPISLVCKRGLRKDGRSPLYLYGYGTYGWSNEPYFSSNRLSLLNRGFIYAIAHVRGGGEMGKYWHEQGRFLNKMNTFTDFIACAEHLIAEKYTSSDKLVISGESAGGTLMGAVTNMRPDLFKTVIAKFPFVDVLNTLLDISIPLTVVEYTELGDPHEKEYYYYIKSYSPYDNVVAKEYPNMLITAGLNDPRVGYWEPAKLTAKLRALKTDRNMCLLKTNMGAGHGGASGRYDYLKEIAFEYALILDLFGTKD